MRILLVEGDATSALAIGAMLRPLGHQVTHCADGESAWACQQAERFRLVILGSMLPGALTSVELCRRIRAIPTPPYVYVLLILSQARADDRADALAAGVDDFLSQPLDPMELLARLRVATRILDSEQRLVELNQRLADRCAEVERLRADAERRAQRDSLTGVLNRGAWFAEAIRNRCKTIALFDIDHFKQINDHYGHPAGDVVLREVAQRLAMVVGGAAVIGRVGGEEFAVYSTTSLVDAMSVCDRMVQAVSALPIDLPDGQRIMVSVSCGLAATQPGALTREESLARAYNAADAALYRAKADGRHRLVVFPAETKAA